MNEVSKPTKSPPSPAADKDALRTKALASLRQGVWEASQFMDYDELWRYVADVLREIESDEP